MPMSREQRIIDILVGLVVVAFMCIIYYMIWLPRETDADKMEGYGFNKVCSAVGYTKGSFPVCTKETWVLGHESVPADKVNEYIRKREAAE